MADPDTSIDIGALHQAILDAIAAQFPDLATVEDYPEDRQTLVLPACIVELDELEGAPEEDPGTDQLAMRARWVARIVIGFRTPAAQREIRSLAAALATFVRLQRWGQPVGEARVEACAPDEFAPEAEQFVVWSVTWSQIVHLGQTIWTNDGAIPSDVLASWAPEIGTEHPDTYTQLLGPETAI